MAPHWFELGAWAALALGFSSALVIAADIALLGNRRHMAIMNLVFPLTALYLVNRRLLVKGVKEPMMTAGGAPIPVRRSPAGALTDVPGIEARPAR